MPGKRARVAAAEDHAFAGDFAAAAGCLREACEDDPADVELWFLQGYYQARAGLPDEAARSLDQALAIDPDHGLAHHYMANCLRDLGQTEPAATHYRRALDRLDDDAETIADFGLHNLRCGDVDLAAAMFSRALELDPGCELAERGLEATVGPGTPLEPEPALSPAPTPAPRRDRRLRGPAFSAVAGAEAAAEIETETATVAEAAPPQVAEPAPEVDAGAVPAQAAEPAPEVDWAAVAREAEAATRADEVDFDAWVRLGGALVKLREFEKAVPVLEHVMARTEGRGGWGSVHADALGLFAEILLEKKDALAAYRVGQSMSRLYPGTARTLYLTGRISALCGDPRQALRSLKEAARLDPDGPVGRAAMETIEQLGG